jgi:hypothetical protein
MITIKAKASCDGGALTQSWEEKIKCPNECEITLCLDEVSISFDKILKTYDTDFDKDVVSISIENKPNDWDISKTNQRCGHCITADKIKQDERQKHYEKSLKRRKKNKNSL